jgi:hypothetical protein
MLVYGMLVFGLAAVLPSILSAMAAAVLSVQPSDNIVWLVLLPYVLPVATVLQIADYVSYRDIFHANEKPARSVAQAGRTNDE